MLRLGDIEIAFERRRRVVAPNAASRLTSLYAVEHSKDGRSVIDRMFPRGSDRLILTVSLVAAIRVTRVDSAVYETYRKCVSDEVIDNYWSGLPSETRRPRWEFLLEGMLRVDDEKGMRKVRQFGATPGAQATPQPSH